MAESAQFELSEDHKKKILDFFSAALEPELSNLVKSVFENDELDGKTKEARAIKAFCKERGLKFKTRTIVLKGLLDLTDEQLTYINNNFRVKSALEIAKDLFNNDSLTNLSQEYRTVNSKIEEIKNFLKKEAETGTNKAELEIININYNPEELVSSEYKPPKTLKQTIERVNHYLNYGYNEDTLKKQQLFEMQQLKKYLNIFRFIYQINTYKIQGDRDLFEDAFIRYTHDKPDLTQEDLDQFITLCNQIVRAAEIQRRIESLRATMAAGEISMKMNEAINVLQTELNSCENIKTKLYNDLTTKRNKRLEEKTDGFEKLINLVQAWKDEEFRKKTIHLAELEKMKVKEEAGRINSMSEIKALLRGATIEELVG
jgi:hypothetical protein